MMISQKVSVITVCYNAAGIIENTIKSVVHQTYENLEYIIVDGASNDSTMAVVAKYEEHISCLISEHDKGIYDAMNKGIKIATGEWIILMNSGDIFADNNVLENVFRDMIPNEITFLYSDVYYTLLNGKKIRGYSDFESGKLLHQAIIYRRFLHIEHGYYIVSKPIIISDYLFFLRIPKEQVKKIDTVICLAECGGASRRFRSGEHALCADYIFRHRSFSNLLINILKGRIKDALPMGLRLWLKSIVRKNQYME